MKGLAFVNFKGATTEELLNALPPDEDNRWEFKSAMLLDPKNRGELRKELGKQVSAFANSGGGYLLFGLSKVRQIEPCEQQIGREPMKDFLATMVEQSVEQPIRHFTVHRIPLKEDASNSVFVVAIEDSPAAPHQAKDERNYFYRIDGHSKPAPHFHLDLLWNRMTRAVLEITDIDYDIASVDLKNMMLHIVLKVHVENKSRICATDWGVYIKDKREHYAWSSESGRHLCEGWCVHNPLGVMLPSERATLLVPIKGFASGQGMSQLHALEEVFTGIRLCLQPISQNHVGQEKFYAPNHVEWLGKERTRFRRSLEGFGLKESEGL